MTETEAQHRRFAARSQRSREFCSVTVSGELDLATGPIVSDEIAHCEGPGTAHVFVDLAGVTFIDTDGIRALCAARRRSENCGREFRLVAVSPVVRRFLELTELQGDFAYARRSPVPAP